MKDYTDALINYFTHSLIYSTVTENLLCQVSQDMNKINKTLVCPPEACSLSVVLHGGVNLQPEVRELQTLP